MGRWVKGEEIVFPPEENDYFNLEMLTQRPKMIDTFSIELGDYGFKT